MSLHAYHQGAFGPDAPKGIHPKLLLVHTGTPFSLTPSLHQVDGYAHPYDYQSDEAGMPPSTAGLDDHYADWDSDKDQDEQEIRQILSDLAAQAGY